MKHSPFTRLAILIFALWLPIQATAAMAAPLCKHMLPHDAAGSPQPAHDDASAGSAGNGAACDECNLCDLACAAALPASAATLVPSAASAPAAPASRQPQLFFPKQPHRPPLASA